MKINLATLALFAAILPGTIFAQNTDKFYSGDKSQPFTEKVKKFNDWSISAGVGVPLIQSADLTSIKNGNGKNLFGYSAYISVDKAITHAFGLNLQYELGQTKQGLVNLDKDAGLGAKTKYQALSLIGDINFSNLLRRSDNHSPYRWALHGYAGIGTLGYKAYRQDEDSANPNNKLGSNLITDVKFLKTLSLFGQAGAGLKFNVNRRIDIEGRVMYVFTGDDNFDGGSGNVYQLNSYNGKEEQYSDNFINATLGITLKLGKHESHLMWHDPLQEIYYRLDVLESKNVDVEVCKKGDADNDGVCDDWDRQLDTPAGARVDGAGVALDADLDGVIDLKDKCVTVPGPVENDGCPKEAAPVANTEDNSSVTANIQSALKDLQFNFGKTTVRTESSSKLDLAANLIKSSNGGTFLLVGHTDKKGNDAYNLKLSQQRAAEVVKELEKRGVSSYQLKSKGVGEADAVASETASDAERLQDRKVEVKSVTGAEWNALPKSDLK